jgi:RNA-directed DNA polymerase
MPALRGIALRGPLSQLFSAIYLKPLDDAFDNMDVFYARYQDDLIILCKTKSQFNRCRRKLMNVLHERRLKLSQKKSRLGEIKNEFHFLGIKYSGTQTPNNITRILDNEKKLINYRSDQIRSDQIRSEYLPLQGSLSRIFTYVASC